MKLLDRLKEIDAATDDVFVIHEKFERRFERHRHEKDQLSYVEDGVAYVIFTNDYWVVPARHFLWIPAGTPHLLKVSHSAIQLHSFYFQPNAQDFYKKAGIYPASNLIIELIKFSQSWDEQYVNFVDDNAHIFQTLYKLLPLAVHLAIKLQLPISTDEKIEEMTQFIQEHYNKPISIAILTKQFNMSERTFCRLFKKSLNTTFLQYLEIFRVIQSITLLRNTALSIEDVANEVGYESLSAFSNIFMEYTGMRPSEMRKLIT